MEHTEVPKSTKMSADRALVVRNIEGGLVIDAVSRSGAIPKTRQNNFDTPNTDKNPTLTPLRISESTPRTDTASQVKHLDSGQRSSNERTQQNQRKGASNGSRMPPETAEPKRPHQMLHDQIRPSDSTHNYMESTPSQSPMPLKRTLKKIHTPALGNQGAQPFELNDLYISDSPMVSTATDEQSGDIAMDYVMKKLKEIEDAVTYYETGFDQEQDYEIKYLQYEAKCISDINHVKDVTSKLKHADLLLGCDTLLRRTRTATQHVTKKIGDAYTLELELQNPRSLSAQGAHGIAHQDHTPIQDILQIQTQINTGNQPVPTPRSSRNTATQNPLTPDRSADFNGLPTPQNNELDTTVDKLNYRHRHQQPNLAPRERALSLRDEIAAAERTPVDQDEDDDVLNLTTYDRSDGDMRSFKVIMQDIRENEPEIYANLSQNEKSFIKKCAQLEESICDCEMSHQATTVILADTKSIATSNKQKLSNLENAVKLQSTNIEQMETSIIDNMNSIEPIATRVDKLSPALNSLAGIVSNHSRAINARTEDLNALRGQIGALHEQIDDLRSTVMLQAKQIVHMSSIPRVTKQDYTTPMNSPSTHVQHSGTMDSTPAASDLHINIQPPIHNEHLLQGIVRQSTAMPPDPMGHQAPEIRGPEMQDSHQFSADTQPFVPSQVSNDITPTEPAPRSDNRALLGTRRSPQNSPYQRSVTGRLQNSPHGDIVMDIHKESLLMLVDKLEGMIVDCIDNSTPIEKLTEFTSILPTVEKVNKQCNESLMKYSEWPDCDTILCRRALTVMRTATGWVKDVRCMAREKDSYSASIGKEFKEDLHQFENNAKQNIFEFFKLFEEYFHKKGTEKQRGDLLVRKYLSPRIALQVSKFNGEYKAVKDFLITRYGDAMTITNTILDDLEMSKRPGPSASYKQTADFFTKALAGIFKIRNLSQIKGISIVELESHIYSRLFTHRLVNLLPDTHRIKFNEQVLDKKLDPQRLQGKAVMDLLVAFINRAIQSLDTLPQGTDKKTSPSSRNRQSRKSPNKAAHLTTTPSISSQISESDDEQDESMHSVSTKPQASQRPTKQAKSSPNPKVTFKFPCPIENHSHELGSCSDYLKLTSSGRYDTIRGRQCFTCLGPRYKCNNFCGNSKRIPKDLLCQDCAASIPKGKKVMNVLICKDDTHARPTPKDAAAAMKTWLPGFNPKLTVELSANAVMSCYTPSCHNCGQLNACSCNIFTKSSSVDPFAKVPMIDTSTGNDIPVHDDDIVQEGSEATLFTMQWLRIRGTDFLTFYDSGASQHLIKGKMAEDANLKVISSRPSTLRVVGGGKVSSEYGLYKLGLGRTTEGKVHEIVCQGMGEITKEFPKCDLHEINKELEKSQPKSPIIHEPRPMEVGGTDVHLIIGLKDPALQPQLIFSLPSGIGVYRSKLTDKFGSTLCYGGPHSAFSNAHKATHGTVNFLMAMFVSSYRNSIYNPFSPYTPELKAELEHAGFSVPVKKANGISYRRNTDNELGIQILPTLLSEADFVESGCMTDSETECQPTKALLDEPQTINSMEHPVHHCWALKSSVPLSRLKQLMEDPDEELIQKSVTIDTKNQKVLVDMPFTGDSVQMQQVDKECFQEPHLPSHGHSVHGLFTNLPPDELQHLHCPECRADCQTITQTRCYGRSDMHDHCIDCSCQFIFSSVVEGGRGSDHLPVNMIYDGWQKELSIYSKVYEFFDIVVQRAHMKTGNEFLEAKLENNCKKCTTETDNLSKVYLHLAEQNLIRENTKVLEATLKPMELKQFQEADGILWHTGRLQEMSSIRCNNLDIDSSFDSVDIQTLLPFITSDSPLFYAYLMHIHMKVQPHCGVETTMKEVMKKMFVLNNPHRIIDRVRKSCTMCRRILKKTMELEMAQHHKARTTLAPFFYNCMADIAYGFRGKPYYGARKECKVYALVIVCVFTSSTSILALEGIQTLNVIQAPECHSSMYGVPHRIFVDNGTQLIALQNTEFSTSDVNGHRHDPMGMTIEVSSAKSHEARGRVLSKLAIDTSTSMTVIHWETCFSKIANHSDDLSMTRGGHTAASDIGWEIITPNQLKLGRNNYRSLSGSISITVSGYGNLLELNRAAQITWYQMFLDRLHHLIPCWLHSDIPSVNDIVIYGYLDSQNSKDQSMCKLGKVISISASGRKIATAFHERVSPEKLPKLKTLSRSIREVSVIFPVRDLTLNTRDHYESLKTDSDTADKT